MKLATAMHMSDEHRKTSGSYYTPEAAVHALVNWAVSKPSDRLLDPSAGDGRFLSLHKRSVGVEQNPEAAAKAIHNAPWALVHEGDFFEWAGSTKEKFECAAGNPPFIRYQHFSGNVRETALRLCLKHGVAFSGLASSWAPFLVVAASLLKPGGRMAFILPAEIGHAPYAKPLLEYLASHFSDVRFVAVREKIFPDLSEDVWLLYAEGFGGTTNHFLLCPQEKFSYSVIPPRKGVRISLREWRDLNHRLRPFLMNSTARELYLSESERVGSSRLGEVAKVGIGYVSGANDFFHLKPSQVKALGIPKIFLRPTVRNGKALQEPILTKENVGAWIRQDEPVYLLNLAAARVIPEQIKRYLDSKKGQEARTAFKCRIRSPWYAVPDVVVPDAFLSYMSGEGPSLVENRAACSGTNSVHMVRLVNGISFAQLRNAWNNPLTKLSCEIEGHPLGGGMLKIEPREAQSILLGTSRQWSRPDIAAMHQGTAELRQWRHHNGR